MRYDFELQYVNTKNFECVNTLSRLVNANDHDDMVIACKKLRKLEAGDLVYARIYNGNERWAPAAVLERVGKINYYNLLTVNRKLIRSHLNQFERSDADTTRFFCDSRDLHNSSAEPSIS